MTESPQESPQRTIDRRETESLSAIKMRLSKVNVEAAGYYPKDWVKLSDYMVELIDSFPVWDHRVITLLEEAFTEVYEVLKERGDEDELSEYVNRWNGWVGEAVVRRVYRQFGLGELKTGARLDMNGVDGASVLVEVDSGRDKNESNFVFFQVKTTQVQDIGVFCVNPNTTSYDDGVFEIGDGTDRRGRVSKLTTRQKYSDLRRGGRIFDFCMEEALVLREEFLEANPKIDPQKHKSRALVLLVGVGAKSQESEPPYGWTELMKMVTVNGKGLKKRFGTDLLGALPQGVPIESEYAYAT